MSAIRKLRRQQISASMNPQELSEKVAQVIQVGEQLAAVAGQISEVNGQLKNLDQIMAEVKAARGLLEEMLQEQSRQRFVTLQIFKHIAHVPESSFEDLEKSFRAEFNRTHNLPEEP